MFRCVPDLSTDDTVMCARTTVKETSRDHVRKFQQSNYRTHLLVPSAACFHFPGKPQSDTHTVQYSYKMQSPTKQEQLAESMSILYPVTFCYDSCTLRVQCYILHDFIP
jgi:hypothetical protein